MTYEEAITELKDIFINALEYRYKDTERAFDMAIEALEKQIPKKPSQIGVQMCTCPTCNHRTVQSDYCTECGQALDWSEGE